MLPSSGKTRCKDCGELTFNPHRCRGGQIAGRKYAAPPATKPSEPAGRLAPRHPAQAPPARVKDVTNVTNAKPQPTPAELMAAIDNLTAALKAYVDAFKPRTDA